MNIPFNNETIKLIYNKIALFFNLFFPGIVVMDLFFQRGLFSNLPENIYSFILYLLWCAILSLPFTFYMPKSVETFMSELIKYCCEKAEIEKKYFDDEINKNQETKEDLNNLSEKFSLSFILITLFLMYIVLKLLVYYNFPNSEYINIPVNVMQFIITFIVVYILRYPVGMIYAKLIYYLFTKWIDPKDFTR